jgi:uncharacterized cupin superfamily protein
VIAHWDEVEWHRREQGEMAADWQRLGNAAGTVGVGVNRIRVDPGRLSTPPHSHGASEELVYVLGGSGLSWQDEQAYELRPRDCIVHLADHEEHTLRGGPEGLEALIFGTRHPTELGWLPRSAAIRLGWPWVQGRTDDPWDVEAQAEPLTFGEPAPRPPNIVNAEDAPTSFGGTARALAAAGGSIRTGLHLVTLPPSASGAPSHCHSAEEEVFIVLDGGGTLELQPSPVSAARGTEREEIELRPGHVVARPPATKIAHALTAGDKGLTYLVYGTREPNDIVYYPESKTVYWRGVGVRGRIDDAG